MFPLLPLPPSSRRRRNQRSTRSLRTRGFSFIEMLFAVIITSLILMTVTGMLVLTLRTTSAMNAISVTSMDAANGIQRIEASLREARNFSLLDQAPYTADAGGGKIVVTGMRVTFPANAPTAQFIVTSAGAKVSLPQAAPLQPAMVNAGADGVTLDIYRADKDGTINAAAGKCLWMKGTDRGLAINRAIVSNIASEITAVQFIQPFKADGVTQVVNNVKISLVTSIDNTTASVATVTSHSTIGTKTNLTGEQVYLRNHDAGGTTATTGAHGRTQFAN